MLRGFSPSNLFFWRRSQQGNQVVNYLGMQSAILVCALMLATAVQAQDTAPGRALADRLCARCHAIGPSDKSRLPKAPPFRVIANRYSVWSLQEALAEGIVTGHHDMPEFKFNPDQIVALLTFMDTFTLPERKSP